MDPQGAEDNVRRLEAFVDQVSATRRHLGSFLASAEAAADGLTEQSATLESRLEIAAQSVSSLTQALETNHQHALAELGSLTVAGTQLAELAVGGARARLEDVHAGFERGLEHTREDLSRTALELAQVSGHAGQAAAVLEEQHAEHALGLGEAGSAMHAGVLQAGERAHAVGTESLASLDAARNHVTDGLEAHLGSTFAMFLSELSERMQPLLADGLGEVSRTVLRCFDELDALVETATNRLTDETEPVLRDLAGLLGDWTRDIERRIDGSTQEALKPYNAEVERNIDTTRRGHEVASEVAQMVPHLATARRVADRIQEMIDVMNPFG